MSLQWQLPRELPADTAQIGQTILKSSNVYRQIGERFDELFPEESRFAELYEPTGRGAISPLLLSLITVFQMLEKVPDRLAAEYVVSRIDWKYALHLPLTYTGFHFSDLSAFRQRLLEHKRERLVFEQFLSRLKALGLIKPRGKMRTDSTHVLGIVERLSQLELVAESIRVALSAVTKLAPTWVEEQLPGAFSEAYEVRQSEYGLSQEAVQAKLVKAGRDGFWFLGQIERSGLEGFSGLTEVETLRRVLKEQFPGGASSPPAIKRPTGDVIETPHEPEVRYGTKRGQGWRGYKAQVTESCDEDRPHLIVDIEPTLAFAHDSPELPKVQARLQAQGTLPGEQYVDQGYMSAQGIVDSQELGIDLVGRPLGDTRGVEGYSQADFQIDEQARQAVCPTGATSVVWGERRSEEGRPVGIQIRFEGSTCRACEAFGRCTNAKGGRCLELHPHRQVLEARRVEAKTESYRQRLRLRAGIEGTISELVRGHDLRHARYRGLAKLRLQEVFIALAVNLKRLGHWWAKVAQAGSRPSTVPVEAS